MFFSYEYNDEIIRLKKEIDALQLQLQAQVDITLDLQVQNAHLLRALKIAGVVVND